MNSPRDTLYRRIIIGTIMLLYITIWSFWFYASHTAGPDDTGPIFMLMLIVIIVAFSFPSFVTYIVLFFNTKGMARKDYLIAFIITLFPILILFIDFITGNLE